MAREVRIRAYLAPGLNIVAESEIILPTPFPWPIDELSVVATEMVDRLLEGVVTLTTMQADAEADDGQGTAPDA